MREHLGVDVDAIYEEDLMAARPLRPQDDQQPWDPDQEEKDITGIVHVKPGKSSLGVRGAAVEGMPHRERDRLVFALIHYRLEGINALGDIIRTDTGRVVRKVMGQNRDLESLESEAADKSLGEERTMESRDHEKIHGFPSSIVPTMEERVVMDTLDSIPEDSGSSRESRAEEGDADKQQKSQNGDAQVLEANQDHSDAKTPRSAESFGDSPTSPTVVEARVDGGELYGAPADASRDPQTDDQPPHAVSGKYDATEAEERAIPARAEIRKHLPTTKFNPKVWSLPTPTPNVDPHGFEDPISDEFWEKVWVACAVHNVCGTAEILMVNFTETLPTPLRPRSTARFSTPSLMTLLPPGSSIRISYSTTNVSINR